MSWATDPAVTESRYMHVQGGGVGGLHQPRTVCLPHAMTYSLFWFLPGTTSNLMEVSPIPWFLGDKADSRQHRPEMAPTILPKSRLPSQKGSLRTPRQYPGEVPGRDTPPFKALMEDLVGRQQPGLAGQLVDPRVLDTDVVEILQREAAGECRPRPGPVQLPPPLSRPLSDAAPTPRARSPETRLPAGLRARPEPESDQTTGQKAKDTQPLGEKTLKTIVSEFRIEKVTRHDRRETWPRGQRAGAQLVQRRRLVTEALSARSGWGPQDTAPSLVGLCLPRGLAVTHNHMLC